MNTILVPTDFSKSAYVAAHYAVELAHVMKAKIVLINTFEIPIPPPDTLVTPISFAELQKISVDQLKKMADFELRVNQEYKDLEISYDALLGSTVSGIIDAARKYKAGMIVMGTHGASGVLHKIMGTNTAEVIAKAGCPVFAIPENAKFTGLKKMAFAMDLHMINNDTTFDSLHEISNFFNSEVSVFSVIAHKEQKAAAEMEIARVNQLRLFENIRHSFHIEINEDMQTAMDDFISKNKADVLITMPHKHNFWQLLFNRSVTQKIAFHTKTPLLCLPIN